MYDVAIFAALGWEARAVIQGLSGVEEGGRPRTWRGYLGDGASCLLVQTGIGPRRARTAAEAAPPARLLLATGCAGGLAPSLRVGDLVIASTVVCLDERQRPVDRLPAAASAVGTWAAARGLQVQTGPLASSPTVLETAAAKTIAASTGALAVEMESGAIATVARARVVPFVGLRVVLDAAGDAVSLGGVIDEDTGEIRPGRAVAAVALRPDRWPVAVRLARQQAAVERRLRAVAAMLLGGGLDALGLEPAEALAASH